MTAAAVVLTQRWARWRGLLCTPSIGWPQCFAYALQVSTDASVSLCGRTYDLKSAYKQFPVSCKDRDLIRMFVNCPDQERPCAVGLNALPFGAIGSVAAFLRVSASVWLLGVIALRIVWTAFFDDYSVISKHLSRRMWDRPSKLSSHS